jgi:uncharacterized membrane protein (UPF0127 family)
MSNQTKTFKKWHLVAFAIIIVLALGNKIYGYVWPKTNIYINQEKIRVLVADTPAHRFKGWSGRADMGKYGGMLFIFPQSDRHAMVMRDMRFSLDIIWLNQGKIIDIAPSLVSQAGMAEDQLTVYRPRSVADMVLEVPAGFAERAGLKIGDTVEIVDKI